MKLRSGILLILLTLCLACRSEDAEHRVTVFVPEEAPSVTSGVLRLSLWAYDPALADAPATLVDADVASFSRVQGEVNRIHMLVRGPIPAGMQRYLTVRGFEVTSGGERYILWDGLEGTGTPRVVVMRPVPNAR